MLILTPNRRLSAFLTRQHNAEQIAAGKNCWLSPEIMPLDAWLTQIWQICLENSSQAPKALLSTLQQQILWENIIQNSAVGVELLRIAPTAKSALQAWTFLRQWQVSVAKIAAYAEYSTDTAAFYTWLQVYLQWLQDNDYIDSDLMLDQLIAHAAEYANKLPREICLLGFDELTPQDQQLFAELSANGITITYEKMTQPGAKLALHSYADTACELTAAAHWAHDMLQQHPTHIIGIVVPELEQKRRDVERIFANLIPANHINISAPLSLASYALIDSALLLLQLAKPIINYADFSIILRSPYIAGAEIEIDLRARLDRELRERVEAKVSWQTLAKFLTSSNSSLLAIINQMQSLVTSVAEQRSPAAWLMLFNKILATWGWPGKGAFTVEEAHLDTCWQELLQKYAQLSVVNQQQNYNQTLQLLQRIANETPFLPAETGETKVHVLGLLEGAGVAFDQLWVSGMDRDHWPPDAAPNPFIPTELQRQLDMPRSSPQRELKIARRLTTTLKQGGKTAVHFSFATTIDDQTTAVSSLLEDIQLQEYVVQQEVAKFDTVALELINDTQAPKIANNMVRGGAHVLKLQADCPFKAFAEIRLQAKPLETPQLILDQKERGKLVHAVLEKFWNECKSYNQLISWLPGTVQKILEDIVTNLLTQWQRNFPITLNSNYVNLEKARLSALITRWLELEIQRAPFTVKQIEEKITLNIGPLQLNVKADRIDQLANGELVIIDYKTGATRVSAWFDDLISEPQMPLYAVSVNENVAAVVYANVVAQHEKLRFSGIGAADVLPGANAHDDWELLLTTWRQKLAQTAHDYANGVAKAEPYSAQVCTKCKLQSLCRNYEHDS